MQKKPLEPVPGGGYKAGRGTRLLASATGFLAVLFGALGAHVLTDGAASGWIATGSSLALPHVAVALWAASRFPFAALLLALGAFLFSGMLYLLALGAPWWGVFVVPVGGVLLLAGWSALFFGLWQGRPPEK